MQQGGVGNSKLGPDLLSLGRIDYQVFWIFYRVTELLDDPTQLKGKRIALGPAGSGTRAVSEKILTISGVTSETATLSTLSAQSAVDALNAGTIDALFLTFAPDSTILQSLIKNPKVRPMSFTGAEALTRIFPFLVRLVLPRGVIDYERKIPANDVIVIATANAILVRKEIHPALIDLLAQTIMEAHNEPGLFQQVGDFPTQTDPEYPLAQSARDFYKNGPSFLNRYLPFWMTSYAKRTIAVLAAVIAIVLPLFSYMPRIYKGLVNQRLNSMYRRLRPSKRTTKDVTALEVSALEAKLESVDRAVHLLAVPMRYSNLYFSLKSHLDLVRTRLGARRAALHSKMTRAA